MTVTVNDLAVALDAVLSGDGTAASRAISSVTHDSRMATDGMLFCCVPGETFDGHDFAAGAVDQGATALLVERDLDVAAPQLRVPDVRSAMGPAACAVYGEPSRALDVVGVTGTNGKTTVVHLLEHILTADGRAVEVFGTLTGSRTTPEGPELQARLAQARDRGRSAVAMEVSSHALELHRVDGTWFRAAVFTNLGHDHLDFHQTAEQYFEAKARLFTAAFTDVAIVNIDDAHGRRLADRLEMTTITYSLADLPDLEIEGPISRFTWRGHPITLQLAGEHNVANALASALAAEVLGMATVDIADALCAAVPPRGRFEFIDVGQQFRVAVDYAHTPDALAAALTAARQVAGDATVSVVFGCGGDRDQQKRPAMGDVAVNNADKVYLTSDNPRHEDPMAIIDAVLAGIPGGKSNDALYVEASREAAIGEAVARAERGEVLVIAGKGHEVEQVTGDTAVEFDDRAVAIEAILRLSQQTAPTEQGGDL